MCFSPGKTPSIYILLRTDYNLSRVSIYIMIVSQSRFHDTFRASYILTRSNYAIPDERRIHYHLSLAVRLR